MAKVSDANTIFWLRGLKTEPAVNLSETAFRQIPEVWDNAQTISTSITQIRVELEKKLDHVYYR